MIIVTGAAGFIGSYVAGELNQQGYTDLVLVDDFGRADKRPNWETKLCTERVERSQFIAWLQGKEARVQGILHLGARTDTTDPNRGPFEELNLAYSKALWQYCTQHQVPFIYASSAATYGDGSLGFSDTPPNSEHLQPLNPYAWSKNEFDKWVLSQKESPFFWAGLKFFNVYGPNEYHKARMASVVFHAFHQIRETGQLKLFKSHRADYGHGEQQRDFIYVRDLARVIRWLMEQRPGSGIFNLGTGQARSFNDLGRAIFAAMGLQPRIEYIDMPADLRNSYQYYTQAEMQRLRTLGYTPAFDSIEAGVQDYVQGYLQQGLYF
ncbi:MAG: ADP-glyceromanno-heptose 6-epimerase [Bacteroidetes bacterium]|jgi:ADP-L-glycero-D-manno-heptose 6-epimerase|nr:ADP-glyceromanno-heptose 6-epimerase [Bacteroidota bacterium]